MASSRKKKYKSRRSQQSMKPIVFGAIGAFVVLAVIATLLSSDDSNVFGEVTVAGDGLPIFAEGTADPAVGMTFPTLEGVDFDGNAVSITDDGRPKLIINLAHW